MPCICEEPSVSWESHLEMMLEQAFRFLTKKQISSIDGFQNYGWIGGLNWYQSHLLMDFHKNYENEEMREFYQNEAKRLGWKLIKEKSGYSINEM